MATKKDNHAEISDNMENLSYNEMIRRIQEITDSLRDPSADIDNMIASVEEAVRLIKVCKTKLTRTGIKVESALKELNSTEQADNG
ncbi:MAG: exodeoxyribonuclease VII small subunit [Proteobacteria bacterium]|jgi:exodeoxyribonuclease VII small subunit|nr:exodeoxyribonuclease VII small subunit [Pseudomonadota bacterium]